MVAAELLYSKGAAPLRTLACLSPTVVAAHSLVCRRLLYESAGGNMVAAELLYCKGAAPLRTLACLSRCIVVAALCLRLGVRCLHAFFYRQPVSHALCVSLGWFDDIYLPSAAVCSVVFRTGHSVRTHQHSTVNMIFRNIMLWHTFILLLSTSTGIWSAGVVCECCFLYKKEPSFLFTGSNTLY